jgi:hypothetical protein
MTVHEVAITDSEMPGHFHLSCTCGWRSRTYYGEEHAAQLIEQHFRSVGVRKFGGNRRMN